jgi:DNA invertase Pin-like site-specific DNA recombinase
MKERKETRAAIYARVSTNNGQNPKMQISELREYCRNRNWKIAGEYVDCASGARISRPQLDQLMSECRKRKIDAVVVYRYDRFARSLRQLVNALAEFDGLGVHFISLHDGVDTTSPNGRLIFGIFASIAEFERELIRQRVRSGLAAAVARGQRLGRPPSCPLNQEKAKQLKRDWRDQKASLRALSRKYGVKLWKVYSLCSRKKATV